MEKSPVRQLFDALISTESVTVTFDSPHDFKITKIRLHQIRKETDAGLASIGEESIFGPKSICFKAIAPLTYQIYLADLRSASRSRFKIISVGDSPDENISANLGGTQTV